MYSDLLLPRSRGRWLGRGPSTLALALALLTAACAGTEASSQAPFADVAAEVGLDFRHGSFRWGLSGDAAAMMGGGVCWLDYDNDGWLDLFLVNSWAEEEWGRWMRDEGALPTSALFRNERGSFTEMDAAAGAALALRGNGCVAADLDRDGWTDLYVTSARESALLWNNGDGTFTEGGQAAGADVYGWHGGAAVGDLNGDGWPDLFVAGYVDINARKEGAEGGFPRSYVGRRDLLYLSEGAGPDGRATFREVGEAVGLEPSGEYEYGLGALLTDLDADGDLDLYVANDTNPNRLYENVPWPGGAGRDPEGIGFRLSETGRAARVGDDNSGMGVAGGDLNGDGFFDLLVTNLGRQPTSVYVNRGAGSLAFADGSEMIGIPDFGVGTTGWGTAWADFDHDTDLDLFIANGAIPITDPRLDAQPLQFFESLTAQGSPGRYQESTGYFGELGPLMARGSAVADFDNDGDLDIAVNVVSGAAVLLRNNASDGPWLEVALDGFHPGATVVAELPDGTEQRCEIRAGSSYLSSEDPRCHFGLGEHDTVTRLSVHWPDGTQTTLENVPADRVLTVER